MSSPGAFEYFVLQLDEFKNKPSKIFQKMWIYQKITLKLDEISLGERTLSGVIFDLNTEIFQIEKKSCAFHYNIFQGGDVHCTSPQFFWERDVPTTFQGGGVLPSPLSAAAFNRKFPP